MVFFTANIRRFFTKSRRDSSSSSSSSNKKTATIDNTTSSNTSSSLKPDSRDGANFQFREGRRYQNEEAVSYVLPNDYDELDRVHQQHWALKVLTQKNFHSPVHEKLTQGITVLDSGCGPATWTLDMAEAYPNSKFYGVDASLVFPQNIKPKNVEFSICNVAKEIPFPDNTFDFIYQRLLILGLTNDDWDKALKELYRVLKPGGYIELVETDVAGFDNIGPLFSNIQEKMTNMLLKRDLAPQIVLELKERLEKAGFIHKKFDLYLNRMNGSDTFGKLIWEDYSQVLLNLRPVMAASNPEWQDEAVYKDYVMACGKECSDLGTLGKLGYHHAIKPAAVEQ